LRRSLADTLNRWTLARICGVEDFNMNDVTRPEGQRFKHVLSGIMNFAKFRYVLSAYGFTAM
jgi:hypothetical protein